MSAMRISSIIAATSIAGAVLLSACASAPGGARTASSARSAPCGLRSEDSIYTVGGPLFRDCGVDRPARLVTANVNPEFRVSGAPRTCYQATVEFVVSALGAPEPGTVRVVSANDDQFADAMRVMVNHLRYSPATKGGEAVRQIVTERRSAAVRTEVAERPSDMGSSSGTSSSGSTGSQTGSGVSSAAAAAAAAVGTLGTRSAAPMLWGVSC